MYITHYPTDEQRHMLTGHLQRINPGLVGVMNDPGFAIHLRRNLPNTAVFYRNSLSHLASLDNNAHLNIAPQTYVNIYRAEMPAHEDVWWHFNNEPGASPEAFAHALECAKLTIAAGGKAVLLNFSTGTPEKAAWKQHARPLLEYMARYPTRLAMGLHAYGTPLLPREYGYGSDPKTWPAKADGTGNLLGRHRHFLDACDEMGIRRAPIMITELGFDWIEADAAYMRSLPFDPGCDHTGGLWCNRAAWESMMPAGYTWERYMVEQLAWTHRAILRWDKEIIGAVLFCLYAQGGTNWEKYDYARVPKFFELMEAHDWTMTDEPTPHPTKDGTWKYNMNVRSIPSTSAKKVGAIAAGSAAPCPPLKVGGNYIWVAIPGGYVAVLNLATGESYVE